MDIREPGFLAWFKQLLAEHVAELKQAKPKARRRPRPAIKPDPVFGRAGMSEN